MKKQISFLFVAAVLATMNQAMANVNISDVYTAGGAYNKMQLEQIEGYKFEKSYIQSLDHVTKDERILWTRNVINITRIV